MFDRLFERQHAIQRHLKGPLLEERLRFLQYWSDNGAPPRTLRFFAHYLLAIMSYLKMEEKNVINSSAIQQAAEKWADRSTGHVCMKRGFSKISMRRFISVATRWLSMLGRLEQPEEKSTPFLKLIAQYVEYMRQERGLSEKTIYTRISILKDFSKGISDNCTNEQLDILSIDKILENKCSIDGYCRRTIQTYASVIRTFLQYLEEKGQCRKGLPKSIKIARVYRHETLPRGPSWVNVKKLLEDARGDHPTSIRDRAILMLLAIYGLRCGEVVKLRLDDLDWKNEAIYVQRAKGEKPQRFPFSQTIGNAILLYLKKVRPRNCTCREVFTTRRAPYRPLSTCAVFQIVSKRLKATHVFLKHYGPHSLRHACATHLINEGVSLKEISDHLGHSSMESTRIYAKVDLVNLRKVAAFDIEDLI